MNYINLIEELKINSKILDEKRQQTDYKIKYVVEYIRLWLIISSGRPNINNINFIDCMCNAGIYKDGDLGTSIEIFLLFKESAKLHPNKYYNLFLNDYGAKRIEVINLLLNYFNILENINNVNVFVSNKDVNTYLNNYNEFNMYLNYNASTVLFVDPYDLGTVQIKNIKKFLDKYYCELIFNFFISDYVRNGLDNRIRNCIGDIDIKDKDDFLYKITEVLRTGKIKHVFSYKFNSSTNTELYKIIFASPSDKGLDVLKQALWEVFNGKFNHRNFEKNDQQLSLFTKEDDRESLLDMHAKEAKIMILNKYKNTTTSYDLIEKFLAENTMMMKSQFLSAVLKPLIVDGFIEKCGDTKNKSNYKEDRYTFIKE